MIKLINVNKYFNKGKRNEIHVINNTNLTLNDNGLVAILGESGCGKTTLLNVLGGLDRVRSGDIYIDNERISSHNVSKVDKLRNLNIGYIFQDYKLIDDLSVFDNVAMALKLIGIKDKEEVKKRVEYVLDKVGILRYRYRPAGTLSGGERQRVGIARALVKNPKIILADEPTGNLDSKNSIEIMNIIKRISMDRLVILVTHERPLAEFYASRIIEIKDGCVNSDYENVNDDALNYEIGNTLYLKDFKNKDSFKEGNNQVNVYSDEKSKLNVNLIIKNGNIYIQALDGKKIEVLDDNSAIEVKDAHKKKLKKDEIVEHDFDMSNVGNQNLKKRYSSIFKPFSEIIVGFKKVFSFSVLKKLLLIGFIFAGIFMVYAIGRIAAITHVEDSDFLKYNPSYLLLETRGLDKEDYDRISNMEGVKFVLPSDSRVSFTMPFEDYYQTQHMTTNFSGSIASIKDISNSDLILGKMPENSKEVVIDETILLKSFFDNEFNYMEVQMAGILSNEDFIGRELRLDNQEKDTYIISGIVQKGSPSIYMDEKEFINVIKYSGAVSGGYEYYDGFTNNSFGESEYTSYERYEEELKLTKKSELPLNDYEVLLPESYSYEFKIGKETSFKINETKLIVTGFYTNTDISGPLVSEGTLLIEMLSKGTNFAISVDENQKDMVLSSLESEGLVVYDSYLKSKEEFDKERMNTVKSTVLVGIIFMVISLIEIFLMTRSSFLSRIKEIGILRAIGTKKFDIYRMFFGEIFAITTLTSLPAMILMYRAESFLADKISFFSNTFYMPVPLLILAILFIYAFNILIGLIPVFSTMLKSPSQILSRRDVD